MCLYGREKESENDFGMSETASIIIMYPVGAYNDPQGKEGLAHFTEHCLLKARVNEENLVSLCRGSGAVVNAKTAMNLITVEIKIINDDLIKFLQMFSKFYASIQDKIELTSEYLQGEKKTVLQEMKTKDKIKTDNRILGTEISLDLLKENDVRYMLSLIIHSKVNVIINNVKNNELETVSDIIKSIFIKYNKELSSNNISINTEKKSYITVLNKESKCNFNLNIVNTDISDSFLIISINTIGKIRNHLKDISDLLIKYLKTYYGILQLQANIEAGCLNILMKGKESNILSALKLIFSMRAEVAIKFYKKRTIVNKHILEDVHYRILHQRYEDLAYTQAEIFAAMKKFCKFDNTQGSLVTNIQLEDRIWECLPKKGNALKTQYSQRYDLNHLGQFYPNNEYVELWETPNYYSNEKYVSHILWAMLGGTTGELYKKLVIEEKLCYSFAFYPRELLDFGYSVLYIKADSKTSLHIFHGIFRELMREMMNRLDEDILELAKRKPAISTGLALGKTSKQAILSGFYEVIERDAFALSWFLKLAPNRRLDIKNYIEDNKTMISEKYICNAYDISIQNLLNTVVVTIHDEETKHFMIGAATRFTISEAIKKAFLEAAQGITYINMLVRNYKNDNLIEEFNKIDSFQKHAAFYSIYPEMRKKVGYFLDEDYRFTERCNSNFNEALSEDMTDDDKIDVIVEMIKNINKDVYYVDITTYEIANLGASAARIIVPGMQPLHGTHRYRFLSNKRLMEIGEEKVINNFPHPFP